MTRRTFKAVIAGVEYEIPTTMTVLRMAEEASGASLIRACADQKYGTILQGVLYAGLCVNNVKQIDGKDLTYDLIGEVCTFDESADNYFAFVQAMSPETEQNEPAKNAPAEETNPSRGRKSGDTATDSSS